MARFGSLFKVSKDDVTAQVRQHLAEKYPRENMDIVVGSFEIKLARALSETYVNTHFAVAAAGLAAQTFQFSFRAHLR